MEVESPSDPRSSLFTADPQRVIESASSQGPIEPNPTMSRSNTAVDPVSEDEDDDDDDEDIDSKRTKLLQKLREDSQTSKYHNVNQERYDTFVKEHRGSVKTCMIDPKNRAEKTLLHYLASRLGKTDMNSCCFQLLVRLILEVGNPKDPGSAILKEQSPDGKHTCLHLAVMRDQFEFVKFVCTTADKGALSDAISILNGKQLNCLHVATTTENEPNLALIKVLVDNANAKTLLERRKPVDEHDLGTLNTALHDFVHVRMCKLMTRRCQKKFDDCDKCSPKEKPKENLEIVAERQKELYLQILEAMTAKCRDAIKVLNKAEQSPYLYHLSTRSTEREVSSWSGLEFEPDDPISNPISQSEKEIPSLKHKTSGDLSSHAESELGRKPTQRSDPKHVKHASQEKPETATKTPKHFKAVPEYSRSLAKTVAKFLMAQSLSQDNFPDTCTSLFGKRLPHTELIFKAFPLTTKTTQVHENFELAPVLACVELGFASKALPATPSGLSTQPTSPDFDPSWQHDGRKSRTDLVIDFFNWLRETKKVKRIVKLIVSDDLDWPCSDETIEDCLRTFDVRFLDWKKEDLDIQSVKKVAENLRELWVPWSGRNSTLYGWSDVECGFKSLLQLRKLHLSVRMGREPEACNNNNINLFKTRLHRPENNPDLVVEDPSTMQIKPEVAITRAGASKDGNFWLKALGNFVHVIKDKANKVPKPIKEKMQPIKVALIDDGVTLGHLANTKLITKGWFPGSPTPEHGSMDLWYYSEKGHGTEMAKLVQSGCPFVNIFVGKLDTRRLVYDTVAKSAVKAIHHAMAEKVHIISMSWTMYETSENKKDLEELAKTINDAAGQGIILFCAGEDRGQLEGNKKPYPAASDTKRIKRIGSAGEYGEKSDFVNEANVDYLFPGEIATEQDQGSSAATALASGLAAMILWCSELYRVREDEKATKGDGTELEDLDFGVKERMISLFEALQTPTNKFVNITDILNEANADADPALSLLRKCKRKVPENLYSESIKESSKARANVRAKVTK